MPYNSETETFYQAPATVVDSTPDGDTVQEGFDDRLTPAMAGLYADLNLLKADGMISVGIPATTTSRGIGRVATSADLVEGATINNGPAFLTAGEEWRFVVGEFYYFRHPTMRPGFAAAQGGLISGAYQGKNITEYPIWAYLQTAEGQLLLKTEAEWQAMSTATWATLADGSKVGWNGIGGAPFYVQDLGAGTLRMPDIRGMYAEAAGFDSLGVGGVDGDRGRNAKGMFITLSNSGPYGVFKYITGTHADIAGNPTDFAHHTYEFDLSRVVPTGPVNAPRRWGALACAYLGQPAL